MPLIPFPDVPSSPGVPAVFRAAFLPSVSEPASFELAALTDRIFGPPRWGLYGVDGRQMLVFETFLGITFNQSGQISSHPVEQGGFASFNKVDAPFEATIKLAHGGDPVSRKVMLSVLERIVGSTELYSVATPEIVYPSANLVKYSYTRADKNGSSLLIVELTLQEVRQTAVQLSPATQDPSGANEVSNGQVQAFEIDAYPRRDQNKVADLEPIQ
ncbi:hypothetical protein IB259_29195 [Achromobacter sp. ACM04]|uniref:phage baseplate protein n=1 Tax=Achromobacter TaxID=222 RepID=UPI001466055E|nr:MULTISPECIES: hypothetical protein [Achromobacter]MBD9423361.1 hypothetical protein [Achromobacter sp. ACM04]CAB3871972.1 hypothetical protein LMG3410_02846 [Achromobacter aegrifaciens]